MKRILIASLIALALATLAVRSQSPAGPSPDQANQPKHFPEHSNGSGNPHRNHQCVSLIVVIGYTNDWTLISNFYQGVFVSTSSSGAPQFSFGDSFADATATLLDAGFTMQVVPTSDQWDSSTKYVFTK